MDNKGATRRTWIKLFVTGWLHGSVRWQLDAAERGCLADLFCMAGECNHDGKICDNDGRPFPLQYIANHLNIDIDLLQRTLDKCNSEGRIRDDDGVLTVANWAKYQSEYSRQKTYRQVKSPTAKSNDLSITSYPVFFVGEFKNVRLSLEEYDKLEAKFGKDGAHEWIEKLSAWMQSNGKTKKDHYATILNWARRDQEEGKGNGAHQRSTTKLPTRYTKPPPDPRLDAFKDATD